MATKKQLRQFLGFANNTTVATQTSSALSSGALNKMAMLAKSNQVWLNPSRADDALKEKVIICHSIIDRQDNNEYLFYSLISQLVAEYEVHIWTAGNMIPMPDTTAFWENCSMIEPAEASVVEKEILRQGIAKEEFVVLDWVRFNRLYLLYDEDSMYAALERTIFDSDELDPEFFSIGLVTSANRLKQEIPKTHLERIQSSKLSPTEVDALFAELPTLKRIKIYNNYNDYPAPTYYCKGETCVEIAYCIQVKYVSAFQLEIEISELAETRSFIVKKNCTLHSFIEGLNANSANELSPYLQNAYDLLIHYSEGSVEEYVTYLHHLTDRIFPKLPSRFLENLTIEGIGWLAEGANLDSLETIEWKLAHSSLKKLTFRHLPFVDKLDLSNCSGLLELNLINNPELIEVKWPTHGMLSRIFLRLCNNENLKLDFSSLLKLTFLTINGSSRPHYIFPYMLERLTLNEIHFASCDFSKTNSIHYLECEKVIGINPAKAPIKPMSIRKLSYVYNEKIEEANDLFRNPDAQDRLFQRINSLHYSCLARPVIVSKKLSEHIQYLQLAQYPYISKSLQEDFPLLTSLTLEEGRYQLPENFNQEFAYLSHIDLSPSQKFDPKNLPCLNLSELTAEIIESSLPWRISQDNPFLKELKLTQETCHLTAEKNLTKLSSLRTLLIIGIVTKKDIALPRSLQCLKLLEADAPPGFFKQIPPHMSALMLDSMNMLSDDLTSDSLRFLLIARGNDTQKIQLKKFPRLLVYQYTTSYHCVGDTPLSFEINQHNYLRYLSVNSVHGKVQCHLHDLPRLSRLNIQELDTSDDNSQILDVEIYATELPALKNTEIQEVNSLFLRGSPALQFANISLGNAPSLFDLTNCKLEKCVIHSVDTVNPIQTVHAPLEIKLLAYMFPTNNALGKSLAILHGNRTVYSDGYTQDEEESAEEYEEETLGSDAFGSYLSFDDEVVQQSIQVESVENVGQSEFETTLSGKDGLIPLRMHRYFIATDLEYDPITGKLNFATNITGRINASDPTFTLVPVALWNNQASLTSKLQHNEVVGCGTGSPNYNKCYPLRTKEPVEDLTQLAALYSDQPDAIEIFYNHVSRQLFFQRKTDNTNPVTIYYRLRGSDLYDKNEAAFASSNHPALIHVLADKHRSLMLEIGKNLKNYTSPIYQGHPFFQLIHTLLLDIPISTKIKIIQDYMRFPRVPSPIFACNGNDIDKAFNLMFHRQGACRHRGMMLTLFGKYVLAYIQNFYLEKPSHMPHIYYSDNQRHAWSEILYVDPLHHLMQLRRIDMDGIIAPRYQPKQSNTKDVLLKLTKQIPNPNASPISLSTYQSYFAQATPTLKIIRQLNEFFSHAGTPYLCQMENDGDLIELRRAFIKKPNTLYLHSQSEINAYFKPGKISGSYQEVYGPLYEILMQGGALMLDITPPSDIPLSICLGLIQNRPHFPGIETITADVDIILVAKKNQKLSDDIKKRCVVVEWDNSTSAAAATSSASVLPYASSLEPIRIDLYAQQGWEDMLLADLTFDASNISLIEGPLLQAIRERRPLVIVTPPKNSRTFNEFYHSVAVERRVFINGEWITLPDEVTLKLESTSPKLELAAQIDIVINTSYASSASRIYLNCGNWHELFESLTATADKKAITIANGLLLDYQNSIFCITENIEYHTFRRLSDHIKKAFSTVAAKSFRFELLPGVKILGTEYHNPTQILAVAKSIDPLNINFSSLPSVIVTNDVDCFTYNIAKLDREVHVVFMTPQMSETDVLGGHRLDPRVDKVELSFEGSEVLTLLENGKTIILSGPISIALYQRILPLLLGENRLWMNGGWKTITGKIHLVLDEKYRHLLSLQISTQCHYTLNDYQKLWTQEVSIASAAAIQKMPDNISYQQFSNAMRATLPQPAASSLSTELDKVMQLRNTLIAQRNAFLVGPPGCGKSHIVRHVLTSQTPFEIFSETDSAERLRWLKGELNDSKKIPLLLVDECDLAPTNSSAIFKGLKLGRIYDPESRCFYNMTTQCVIGTGNGKRQSGRKTHTYWEDFANQVEFSMPSAEVIQEKHLTPFAGSVETAQELYFLIEQFKLACPHIPISIRDYEDLAICFSHQLTKVHSPAEALINTAFINLVTSIDDSGKRQEFIKTITTKYNTPPRSAERILTIGPNVKLPETRQHWIDAIDQRIRLSESKHAMQAKRCLLLDGELTEDFVSLIRFKLTEKIYEISAGDYYAAVKVISKAATEGRPMILHNINMDARLEDVLNQFLTGYDMKNQRLQSNGFFVFATRRSAACEGNHSFSAALLNRSQVLCLDPYTDEELQSFVCEVIRDKKHAALFVKEYRDYTAVMPDKNMKIFHASLELLKRSLYQSSVSAASSVSSLFAPLNNPSNSVSTSEDSPKRLRIS